MENFKHLTGAQRKELLSSLSKEVLIDFAAFMWQSNEDMTELYERTVNKVIDTSVRLSDIISGIEEVQA